MLNAEFASKIVPLSEARLYSLAAGVKCEKWWRSKEWRGDSYVYVSLNLCGIYFASYFQWFTVCTHTRPGLIFQFVVASVVVFCTPNKLQAGATPLDKVLMSAHRHPHTLQYISPWWLSLYVLFRSRASVRMRNFCHLCSLQFDNEAESPKTPNPPTLPMCQVFAADFNFGHLMSGWPLQRLPTTFEMCAK